MPLDTGSFLSEKGRLTPTAFTAMQIPNPLYKMAAEECGGGKTNTGFTEHCWSKSPALGLPKPREGLSVVPMLSHSCCLLCNCFLKQLLLTLKEKLYRETLNSLAADKGQRQVQEMDKNHLPCWLVLLSAFSRQRSDLILMDLQKQGLGAAEPLWLPCLGGISEGAGTRCSLCDATTSSSPCSK